MASPTESPFIIQGVYGSYCLLLQMVVSISGYCEAPKAQSTTSLFSELKLNSVIVCLCSFENRQYLWDKKLPIHSQIGSSSRVLFGLNSLDVQLQLTPGTPSCKQIVRSIEQVRKRKSRIFTAEDQLHFQRPHNGKSSSTFTPVGQASISCRMNADGFAIGKYIILPAFTFPQRLRIAAGPKRSLPLSPATTKSVLFLLG